MGWINGCLQAKLTIHGGAFMGPKYRPNTSAAVGTTAGHHQPPLPTVSNARYYYPDNGSDPRFHYGGVYVRDFTYTFSMAAGIVPPADIANVLDYFMSGQDVHTGEFPEGGTPPTRPRNVINCWDEGPFMAIAAAKYAALFGPAAQDWLCGVHPAGGSRLTRLQRGLAFLDMGNHTAGSAGPHLVTASSPHCMYGFTDMEPKQGHVLFTSLLVLQATHALANAVEQASHLQSFTHSAIRRGYLGFRNFTRGDFAIPVNLLNAVLHHAGKIIK